MSSYQFFFSRALTVAVDAVGIQIFLMDQIDFDGAGGERGGQSAFFYCEVDILAGNLQLFGGFADGVFFCHGHFISSSKESSQAAARNKSRTISRIRR